MRARSLGWEDPLKGAWQPGPVYLPGEFHGQSLVDYSPFGKKKMDMTAVSHHARIYRVYENSLNHLLNSL